MSVAKGQTTCVLDPAVTARIKPLVLNWGIRPLARKIGIRREAILAAERGTPMTERMWRRISDAIASVSLTPAPEDIVPVRERESRPASPMCTGCGLRRVFQSGDVGRTVCHKCRNNGDLARMSRCCSTCGADHPGNDAISASFCCILVPEKVGECGWCGVDLVRRPGETDAALALRRYCNKACSISFHADASGGVCSEAMIDVAYSEYA